MRVLSNLFYARACMPIHAGLQLRAELRWEYVRMDSVSSSKTVRRALIRD